MLDEGRRGDSLGILGNKVLLAHHIRQSPHAQVAILPPLQLSQLSLCHVIVLHLCLCDAIDALDVPLQASHYILEWLLDAIFRCIPGPTA